MGLFDKIKNILFEDEDEIVDSIPIYGKEDLKRQEVKKPKEVVRPDVKVMPPVAEEKVEPIDMNNARFKNVKRDIDLSFDDEDVFSEIPRKTKEESFPHKEPVKEEVLELPKESPKTVFQSFDEEEFERLNARVTSNETRARKEIHKVPGNDTARRANNNFSPTMGSKEMEKRNLDRYKIDGSMRGKKPFTPSPVISPVYGILDKNYTKDEIVDKKNGLKREKINPVVYTPEISSKIEPKPEAVSLDVSIDAVRKKAFGELEDMEQSAISQKIVEEQDVFVSPNSVEDVIDEVTASPLLVEENESIEETQKEEVTPIVEEIKEVKEEPVVENNTYIIPDDEDYEEVVARPRAMDDMEKTSTLQILDDIERELNAIKPIHEEYKKEEPQEEKEDDSLETDLFNLIDSMYEQGEEEEDD